MLVTNMKQVGEIKKLIGESEYFAYDYETYETFSSYSGIKKGKKPIDMLHSVVAGVAYGFKDKQFYVPVGHKDTHNFSIDVINSINKCVTNQRIIAHNLKFEYEISIINGVYFPFNNCEDTMLMADELSNENRKSLKVLGKQFLNFEYDDPEFAKNFKMCDVTGEQTQEYACNDVRITYALYELFMEKLDPAPYKNYKEVELPIVKVIGDMELRGVAFDAEECDRQKKECEAIIAKKEQEIYSLAGEVFNTRSPIKLREILFDKLGITPYKKTKTGYSTDKETLHVLSGKHPIIDALLDCRKFETLNSLFLSKMPHLVNKKTGRIHAQFRQANVDTSRFSSSSPNLQQLKKSDSYIEFFMDDWKSTEMHKIKITTPRGTEFYNEDDVIVIHSGGMVNEITASCVTTQHKVINNFFGLMPITQVERIPYLHWEKIKTTEPIKTNLNIRKLFVPDSEDEVIVALDFAGIELRVAGMITGDKTMLDAFKNGEDLHTVTTKGIFGDDIVNNPMFKEYRKLGKIANFLLLYGGGAGALASQVTGKLYAFDCIINGVNTVIYANSLDDLYIIAENQFEIESATVLKKTNINDYCQNILDMWYKTFNGLEEFQSDCHAQVVNKKYVETKFGRRRYFETVDFSDFYQASRAMRQGFNFLIQGFSAGLMKKTMLRISEEFKMWATVHDELVFSVPKENLIQSLKILHRCFTDWDFEVPIYSSVSIGDSYGTMKDYEKPNGDADFEGIKNEYST